MLFRSQTAIAERTKNGEFESIDKFAERLDSKAVNKKILENLVKAGAFDYSGVRTVDGVRGWGSTSVEARKHHVYTGLTNSIGILQKLLHLISKATP